ncbi:MAG: ATP-binding protein [Pseudohongiellaceae bacterium]
MRREVFLRQIDTCFQSHPIVGILGPRQCGKTTLARDYIKPNGLSETAAKAPADEQVHYFDLEDPDHLNSLSDPKLALESLEGLIVIDEIQRLPELYPVLRVLIDRRPLKQRYLVLGSASRDLLRQTSESLAGRIIYLELPPFTIFETENQQQLWLRGGFPPAYLAANDTIGINWRKAYIASFLERDLPMLGIDFAPNTMRRLWMMLAHWNGKVFNASEFARSLDVSAATVKRYLDILAGTFMVRILQPWHTNIHKRQIKSPKVYFRDTGIMHALLNLPDLAGVQGHPSVGASWEGFALEQVTRLHRADASECFFWGTHATAELDLLLMQGDKKTAYEFKYTSTPKATRSMHTALEDLQLEQITIIYPGNRTYSLTNNIRVVGLKQLVQESDIAGIENTR